MSCAIVSNFAMEALDICAIRIKVRHTGGGRCPDNESMERAPAVYILASQRNGTLYVGVTSNLQERVWKHKTDLVAGFTASYRVHQLVYYELHSTMYDAIVREKRIKEWKRAWKLRLIESMNPEWRDLSDSL